MVQYWKRNDKVQAKLMKAPDGSTVMQMENEAYPFPGFPRGHLLFGSLSKLKHEIKNQVFNDHWAKLEAGMPESEIGKEVKKVLPNIFEILKTQQYHLMPSYKMVPPVREIHRAWTKVATSKKSLLLRDTLCHIIQEDDSYRFRLQWLVMWFNPSSWYMRLFGDPVRQLEKAMVMLEHGEVIGDMKERVRLWRRITLAILKDPEWRMHFLKLCREIDWNKIKLSPADKFFFRGKYFKVDLDKFDY